MRLDATERGFLQVAVRHYLQDAFRELFNNTTTGVEPPELRDVALHVEMRLSPRATLDVRYSDGRRWRCEFEIPWQEVRGQSIRPETVQLTWEANRLYSTALEDHYVRRECANVRGQLMEAQRLGAEPHLIHSLACRLAETERHAREHHRLAGVRHVDETDTIAASRIGDAYRAIFRPGLATERRQRMLRAADLDEAAPFISLPLNWESGVGSKEANAKGLALLNEHLTPHQRAQYEAHKYFDVTGGASGKTYRIKHGRQLNVYELDGEGKEVQGWCFLPSGNLVAGDVMLGQKHALELCEPDALKIANKFGASGSATYTELVTATLRNHSNELADNITRSNPLLMRLAEARFGVGTAQTEAPGGLQALVREPSPEDVNA